MGGNSFTLFVSPHLLGGGGVPWSGSASQGGVPCQGVPHLGYPPHQTCPGGTPCWGGCTPPWVPPSRSDLARGYPTSGTPPVRSGRGGPPQQTWLGRRVPPCREGGGIPLRETNGVLDTPRSVCLLRLRWRTFLFEINFVRI